MKEKKKNWNENASYARIIKHAKAQIMHRKYFMCCTTSCKYLETNISNYSNYFDNYSNEVEAFRLPSAISSIYGFLLYMTDSCWSAGQDAVRLWSPRWDYSFVPKSSQCPAYCIIFLPIIIYVKHVSLLSHKRNTFQRQCCFFA